MIICRAEDGEVFKIRATVSDIDRSGNLEAFLYKETNVEPDSALAFLTDGRRLKTENVRDLTSVQDQTIYVFNKDYLEMELDDVLNALHLPPSLEPPVDDYAASTPPLRPSQQATAYLRGAHVHLERVTHQAQAIRYQYSALRLSFGSLDRRVLQLADVFEGLGTGAEQELARQTVLLGGLDADLEIVGRVRVHSEFMSSAVRRAVAQGGKERTLGDYVSNVKMRQVAESCALTHSKLEAQYIEIKDSMARLIQSTEEIRSIVADELILRTAENASVRCQDLFDRMTDAAGSLESPASDSSRLIAEIRQLDSALRQELVTLIEAKNNNTRRLVESLRHISVLNEDIVRLPGAFAGLQEGFKRANTFSHIQRLHGMLYAYGFTVIEIVRRKEFAHFFIQRSQGILEVMAKLSANERKRRQMYRSEINGQLPFDVRGLDDDVVPTVDFSPTGTLESSYSLERSDIEALMKMISDLERFASSELDVGAQESLQETRRALSKAITKMDGLESSFDRIAERSLLSVSRMSTSHRRNAEVDDQVLLDLTNQLQEAQRMKTEQEAKHRQTVESLQAEIAQLKSSLEAADLAAAEERERAANVERDLHLSRAQVDSDTTARRVLEERNAQLVREASQRQQQLVSALADATEQARSAEALRQELARVRAEAEDLRMLEARNASKINTLLNEHEIALRNLEEARARGEDLESQIASAQGEGARVRAALEDAEKDKDRLLRVQATEHDRAMRDHIAEADGDRAVLEHQFLEMKAQLEHISREYKDAQADRDVAHADASGLREELQRVEQELRDARHTERILREDLRTSRSSRSGIESRVEKSERLVAQLLDVALAFRTSHERALSTANHATASSHHHNALSKTPPGPNGLTDSVFSSVGLAISTTGLRRTLAPHMDEPTPLDPTDPEGALEVLRSYDHDAFIEAIAKVGSTIRKWQKQCKDYRDRAKGKISFRNFAKGDLALFLPTRNSLSKPWAAFNVSFPHYFLQATGHLAEQLKSREWVVARITSITERIVNQQDPLSNPYGLGDGTKYYMLQVEDWTQPAPSKKRPAAKKAAPERPAGGSLPSSSSLTTPLPPGPPAPAEEEELGTTRPPTSTLFPVRARSSSSPSSGRPSALSRLLAQAPANGANTPPEPEPEVPAAPAVTNSRSTSPSSTSSPPEAEPTLPLEPDMSPPTEEVASQLSLAPSSPTATLKATQSPAAAPQTLSPSQSTTNPTVSPTSGSHPGQSTPIPVGTSPRRPGSRASRLSVSSRRPAFPVTAATGSGAATVKASPTTALSELPELSTSPFIGSPTSDTAMAAEQKNSPSPQGSVSEDVSRLLNRRRTTSYHVPRSSPLAATAATATATPSVSTGSLSARANQPRPSASSALANLASSWGVPFGRRKSTAPIVHERTDSERTERPPERDG